MEQEYRKIEVSQDDQSANLNILTMASLINL